MYNYTMDIFWVFIMSTVKLTKWGNSIGVRIPATIIKKAHLISGEELEINTDDKGRIILAPIKNQQADWLEKFNAIADSQQESTLMDLANDFDKDDWTW